MRKKDYELIAYLIKMNTDSQDKDYIHKGTFLTELTNKLEATNTKFKRAEFLALCGVTE